MGENEDDKFEFKETGVEETVKKPKKIAEESLYEPVGADREEFVKSKQTQKDRNDTEIQEEEVINDNVIGFDVTEGKKEGNDGEKDADHDNQSSLVPPKLPERRKNSSKQSLNKVSICEKEKVERKEKKSSFIKEWQKDLKEFFSLRKKSHPHQAKFLRIPLGGKGEKYQLIMKVSFSRTILLMDSQITVILQWKNLLKQQIPQKMALTQVMMKIIIQMKLCWLKSHLQITLKEERRKEKTEGRPTVSAMRQMHQSQKMEMRMEIS